jgi:hypothetical protein
MTKETGQRMKSKFGLGAGFVLTAVAIAVGCGSKTTNNIGGTSGELSQSQLPASAISQNNLAPDGGGFSNNNQNANINQVKCAFNVPAPDGAATATNSSTSADGSAMVVFATGNTSNGSGGNQGRQRVYAAYWNGSAFTPPTEITGLNRDETVVVGTNAATNIAAVIMIPFNTSNYNDPTGGSPSLTRANQGNWVILWDAQTFGGTALTGTQGPLADLNGVHHTVYATTFIKSLAQQPITTTNLIGNNAASGTANGKTAVKMQFGFQIQAPEITNELGQQETNGGVAVSGSLKDAFVRSGAVFRPASDIVSFGAATDTFVHCASFGSTVNDVSGLTKAPAHLGNLAGNTTFGATNAPGAGVAATPNAASYEIGDNTSFIQLFWVQMVTSHGLTGQTFIPTGTGVSAIEIGPSYQLFTANLNLSTMTVGGSNDANVATGQSIVTPPAQRNSSFGSGDARKGSSAQALANFVTYNNLVFYNWLDASLNGAVSTSPGVSGEGTVATGNAAAGSTRSALTQVGTVLNVVPGANGSASVAAAVTDITMLGSNGAHSTKTSTQPGGSSPVDVGDEFVTLSGLCNSCGIIGPDEQQVDVVAFVLGRVTTFTTNGVITGANTAGNTDGELWAILLNANGSLEVGGTNPRRVSEHSAELNAASTGVTTRFVDGVGDVKVQSSRDGTYDLLAWRQAAGNSQQASLALNGVVYKTAFIGSQSLVGAALPTLDTRLTRPTQLNTGSATTVAYTGVPAILVAGWTGSPVAAYDFQGNLAYRCGFQSDNTKISILYLYSDGSDERLFIRQLTTNIGGALATAPTLTLGTEAEIEPTASVAGQFVNNNATGVSHGNPFHFLPGSHGALIPLNSGGGSVSELNTSSGIANNGPSASCSNLNGGRSGGVDLVQTCDAGPSASGGLGDVLVVFSKTNVATIVGSGGFDHQVVAVLYSAGAIASGDRIVLSRNLAENQQGSSAATTLPSFIGATQTLGGFGYGTPKTQLLRIVPNTRSAATSPGTLAPSNGTYILLTDFVGNDVSSPVGLFARHFRARNATGQGAAQVSFVANFFPASGTDPVRIDVASSDSDATFIDTLTNGRTMAVFFRQDNHVWCTETSDGETYTNKNGLSNPFLVDDNISSNGNNINGGAGGQANNIVQLGFCRKTATTCDNLSGTILAIVKDDVNLNQRIYIRVMQ